MLQMPPHLVVIKYNTLDIVVRFNSAFQMLYYKIPEPNDYQLSH